jgi:hypothetical protein
VNLSALIGNYAPPSRRTRGPGRNSGHFENLCLELRRGCLPLAVLAELETEQCGCTLRQALAGHGSHGRSPRHPRDGVNRRLTSNRLPTRDFVQM